MYEQGFTAFAPGKRRGRWVDKLPVRPSPAPKKEVRISYPTIQFIDSLNRDDAREYPNGINIYFFPVQPPFLFWIYGSSNRIQYKYFHPLDTVDIMSILPVTLTCLIKCTSVLKWVWKKLDSKVRILRQLHCNPSKSSDLGFVCHICFPQSRPEKSADDDFIIIRIILWKGNVFTRENHVHKS